MSFVFQLVFPTYQLPYFFTHPFVFAIEILYDISYPLSILRELKKYLIFLIIGFKLLNQIIFSPFKTRLLTGVNFEFFIILENVYIFVGFYNFIIDN